MRRFQRYCCGVYNFLYADVVTHILPLSQTHGFCVVMNLCTAFHPSTTTFHPSLRYTLYADCAHIHTQKQSFFNCLLDMAAMDKSHSRAGSLSIDGHHLALMDGGAVSSSQTYLLSAGHANGTSFYHQNGQNQHHHHGHSSSDAHPNDERSCSLQTLARQTSIRNRSLR